MANILDFTKGDRITRVQPAKPLSSVGFPFEMGGDRSYMGEEFIFVGIASGQIYLQRSETSFEYKLFGDKFINLDIDLWDEGWERYIDPQTLLNDNVSIIVDKTTLEHKLEQAISSENYELAAKIREQLKML